MVSGNKLLYGQEIEYRARQWKERTLRESSTCVVDMESRPDEEIVAIKQELHCNKTSAHM